MAAFDTTPGSCYGGPAVAAFTPICSFSPLTRTTPLTFDVPTPHIALPLPPNECTCFDFVTGTANAAVTPSCVSQATASVSVAIAPSEDCCAGRYTVTPSLALEMPCMPFQVVSNEPVVHNRSHDEDSSSGHGTDGSVTVFKVVKGEDATCCTLESSLEITLPDCVKNHPGFVPGPQVKFCERVSGGTVEERTVSNFIELYEDKDNCALYPIVHELTLPCCSVADVHLGGNIATDRIYLEGPRTDNQPRDYIDWSFDLVNCTPSLSFDPHISCKCLSFKDKDGAAKASAEATPSLEIDKAKVSVTIAQKANTSCCDGAFVITPEIEVPACSIADIPKGGMNRVYLSVDHTGGFFDWRFSMTNCVPELEIVSGVELPCVCPTFESGSFEVSPTPGIDKARISIDIDQKFGTSCCNPVFEITPEIAIPSCMTPDSNQTVTVNLANGGYADITLNMTNCVPTLTVDSHPVNIDIPELLNPCVPTISATQAYLNVKYVSKTTGQTVTTGRDAEHPGANGATVKITSNNAACPTYTVGVDGILDLTDIGAGIGSGGPVFQGADKNLYVDGETYDETTWYGGGYGNKVTDDPWAMERAGYSGTDDGVFCRGRYMRNTVNASNPRKWYDDATDIAIPSAVIENQQLVKPNQGKTAVAGTTTKWSSSRKGTDNDNRLIKETNPPNGCKFGNLSTTVVSGFQWHDRGTAAVISHLLFNDAGILSKEEETQHAVLLAPAPAVTKSQTPARANLNASGLFIAPEPGDDLAGLITTGLSVKAGDGLRIYGIGDGRHETDDTYTNETTQENRQGALEIHYGAGFRIVETPAGQNTNPVYHSVPSGDAGAIEVNYGLGLRMLKTPKNGNTPADYKSYQDATAGAIEVNYGAGLRMIESVNSTSTPPTYSYRTDTSRTAGALEVNYGKGLRMVKTPASGNTPTAYETVPAEMAGAIEVQYGPGLHAISAAASGTGDPTFANAPSSDVNAIMPHDGLGLRIHGVTKQTEVDRTAQTNELEIYRLASDIGYDQYGRLAINDKDVGKANEVVIITNSPISTAPGSFTHGSGTECSIGVAAVYPALNSFNYNNISGQVGFLNTTGNVGKVDLSGLNTAMSAITAATTTTDRVSAIYAGFLAVYNFLALFGARNIHVSEAGTIMSINGTWKEHNQLTGKATTTRHVTQ